MASRFAWDADEGTPEATNGAQLTMIPTGRRRVLAYDASTSEGAVFEGPVIPQGWTGPFTCICKGFMASAVSGGVTLQAELEAVTSGDTTDLDAVESFDSPNQATSAAVPGTAGYPFEVSITLTNHDSSAAGDWLRLRLRRLPADAGDTATGDYYLKSVEIRDAA